eukprot:CAMPEP_0196138236 /NCGR_PEP_ID=MMETSP0910-20130528/5941_1 /TAXON_ID=49265 /ORGANISM="Thalassiosira rotula, Strain GSO102" /LENGTH=755 /DNA_ID=CAMNT_0041398815 /DNA_START=27 /DNA_END=2294 /DNA_ORIENTATION=+
MTGLPTIDNIASALSLLLTALASLRAASRLEQRICNNGSIGLMDGPPILGPTVIKRPRNEVGVSVDGAGSGPSSSPLNDADRIEGKNEEDDCLQLVEASPLWEHTEAFRRAVILGLLFDYDDTNNCDSDNNSIFSEITNDEDNTINFRGESEEDLAIAAAVEAGLLTPSSSTLGINGGATRHRRHHRVRGGETSSKSFQRAKRNHNNSNPLGIMTSWLMRELSAPLSAVPAWHGLLCSYVRQQKENKLLESQWCLLTPWERLRFLMTGRSSGRVYDPVGLDFDASISASARIPSCDVVGKEGGGSVDGGSTVSLLPATTTKAVRVKAFAPKTFRDLRNKCFRMNEKEYARSILNAMNGATSMNAIRESYSPGESIATAPNDDFTIPDILDNYLSAEERTKKRIRRKGIQTLPYISFQSNSKGAARAGTFFFFTADGAFMIKTVKKEEAKAFLEMLPEYHRFMSEDVNGRNSLLTRIFGMYSVQFPSEATDTSSVETGDRWDGGLFSSTGRDGSTSNDDDERVYLVMHSVFPCDASSFMTERFDLKGSTVGRVCSLEERRTKGANAVLKDLDLKREVAEELNEVSSGGVKGSRYGICIGSRRKMALMAQLERDVDLLHRCNVLDYSLLVGVADMEHQSNNNVGSSATSKAFNNKNNNVVPKCLQNFFRWMDFPLPYYGAGTTKVDGGALSSMQGSRRGKQVMYYMGVIDFLQPWTVKKRLERDLKGLAGMDTSAISCVAPADYASRFLEFVDSHVT